MKAKAVQCYDAENDTIYAWTVLIQKKKGSKFNVPLAGDGKVYQTFNKEEAERKAREVNAAFFRRELIKEGERKLNRR